MEKKIILSVLVILFIIIAFFIFLPEPSIALDRLEYKPLTQPTGLWKYQCVDTMKTSRDKARQWEKRADLKEYIDKEMQIIKELGANCVAIDTPYDREFMPYLQKWAQGARSHNLNIWYRGNFSGWEGWFNYKKGMTATQLLENSARFIESNPTLFEDGDIFTAAPEAENGGPFNQVEIDEYTQFRRLLIDEYAITTAAFKKINKKVETHWLSMNGGLAQRMLDQNTINNINNTATLDHYIKTPAQMSEFIRYFNDTFKAKTVIGEFGAPIPEINGNMNEDEQALFIDQLFNELYLNKDLVEGINYWVLSDSSTELASKELVLRKAATVVKKYYSPVLLHGQITDSEGNPIPDTGIIITSPKTYLKTDREGRYSVILPYANLDINIAKDTYLPKNIQINVSRDRDINYSPVLTPVSQSSWSKLTSRIKHFSKNIKL